MKMKGFLFLLCVFISHSTVFAQTQRETDVGFEWVSLEDAQNKAKEIGKKILLFGYAEWCSYCLKTRKETFPDSTVLAFLREYYIPVQLDTESEQEIVFNGNKTTEDELARYLNLNSFPKHYFIDSNGEIIGVQPGFLEPNVYSLLLEYVGSDGFKSQSFDEFIEDNKPGIDNQ
jgi:thioredoxin-related protein